MNRARVEELRRYVGFDEADARLLDAARDAVAPGFPRVVRLFYDKIREHEEAFAVLTGEEQIARQQRALEAWLHRLFGGVYDEAYDAYTERIGQVHVQVGLPQRYMLSAMTLIRLELIDLIDQRAADPVGTRAALNKALDVDLAIMLDAYSGALKDRYDRLQRMEREEAATSARLAERSYVTAFELTRDLVVGVDDDGVIRLFNAGAEAVTGYGREEVIGQPFVTTILAEVSQRAFQEALARARTERRVTLDCFVRTRAAHIRDVHWELTHVKLPAGAFLIGHDNTEEKALAERRRRTEKLAAVGTLAAGLAHEIRNPLNGAHLHIAYLERTLSKMGTSHDTIEAVRVVGDEIRRLASLVSEFLDFARPQPLTIQRVTAESLCERALDLVTPAAEAANVLIGRDYPTRPVSVEVDAAKMEQVILNLATNAVEALGPAGGGHVTARVRRRPQHAVIEMEDSGPGVPAESPIFDAFYSTKPKGTGLGLAIALRIVTDHGGALDVESRPGHTVFRIVLPLDPRDEAS